MPPTVAKRMAMTTSPTSTRSRPRISLSSTTSTPVAEMSYSSGEAAPLFVSPGGDGQYLGRDGALGARPELGVVGRVVHLDPTPT
jgi:hypothetical protein